MTSGVRIYLAAPLFNEREREFNQHLADKLSQYADVFLPQRDGKLLVDLIRAGVDKDEAERRVFDADLRAMRRADLLIAVLDGAHVDEGVAFEIGFMNGAGSLCIGLQSDVRRALPSGNNPMIKQGIFRIFGRTEHLVLWVSEWSSQWVFDNYRDVA